MAEVPDKIQTWQMVQPTSRNKETGEVIPGKLEKTTIPVPGITSPVSLNDLISAIRSSGLDLESSL